MLGSLIPLSLLTTTVLALDTLQQLNTTSRSTSTISAAWYTGWHAADFPLSQVSWSKYTHLTYAFATTTPDVNVLSLDISDQNLLPQFVSAARKNGVKASLSIGGWTGSRWFSSNVGTAQNRTSFVKTVNNIAQKYKLDGLDFDWEFPGIQGIGCNLVNSNDTSNFLSFLQELRNSTIGKNLILSAATYVTPWVDSTGSPSTNVAEFSKVLDYMAIMNYDIKSNPATGAGPSSPLDDSCAPVGARAGSAKSAVSAWTDAGMPIDQIVLGVPAYGHSFVISPNQLLTNASNPNAALSAYPAFTVGVERRGDRWDGDGGLDTCGVMTGPGGVYTYWGLIEEGFLNEDGSVQPGIEYRFDDCSETPYLYNSTSEIYVSYDNPQSYAVKGGFIHSSGLKGFAIWEAGGDFNDVLLDSICASHRFKHIDFLIRFIADILYAFSERDPKWRADVDIEGSSNSNTFFFIIFETFFFQWYPADIACPFNGRFYPVYLAFVKIVCYTEIKSDIVWN
ncbi:glycoside hydrolase superfamily [Crassisporium funariophilum]|nr:glycoside hydrolase superfamily [Crassisporium funariophilum]